MEQPAESPDAEQPAENLSELDQIRASIQQMSERTDNQIAQLMLMIAEVAKQLPQNPETPSEPLPQDPDLAAVQARLTQLEQSLARSKEITSVGFDINKLCLFPNARLPEKFEPIDFTKFDGTGDPKAHLTSYVGALSIWNVEKDAMAQMFSQTLVGPALHWFASLEESRKKSWEDICEAFVAQFDYNIQLEVTIRELESTKMGPSESFMDFVRRWRAKTAQMQEKPSEKDQIRMIARNLQPALAKHMVLAQASSNFKTFFDTGLAVEEAVQSGILTHADASRNSSKLQDSVNLTIAGITQTEPVNQIKTQTIKSKQPRAFSQFSVPLSKIFEKLLESNLVKPLIPTPLPQKLPHYHDSNAFCAFHQMPGHATDDCLRLRHKIQDLIDKETIPEPNQEARAER